MSSEQATFLLSDSAAALAPRQFKLPHACHAVRVSADITPADVARI